MSSAWKHSTIVSSYRDFGYLLILRIKERGEEKLGVSCLTNIYLSELFISIVTLKVDGEFELSKNLIEVSV